MELKRAIVERASVRAFKTDPVPVEDLRELVRLAGRAPSVNNMQPWKYIAVLRPELKRSMVEAVRRRVQPLLAEEGLTGGERYEALLHNCTFFGDAPAVLAVATRTYQAILDKAVERVMHVDCHELRGHGDEAALGASIQSLLLAATDMGYGTHWMTGPLVARPELEQMLSIEPPWRLGALIALGRPSHVHEQSDKLPIDEIFEIRQ